MSARSIAASVTVMCLCLAAASEGQDLRLQRGNDFMAQGDFAAAERLFREALQSEPGNRVYRAQLGLCLMQQKRHEEAERELQTVLTQYPDDVAASWYLAQNKYLAGSYREAAGRFRSVSRLLDQRSGQYYSAYWFIGTSWRAVLLRKPADLTSAIVGGGSSGEAGLAHSEVDEMVDAYRKYLDLQPQAPDRSAIEQFLAWVYKNRPPANVRRWIIVNQP
ncbi:MAG: tetratricopeptide repeat protein [bacterium]